LAGPARSWFAAAIVLSSVLFGAGGAIAISVATSIVFATAAFFTPELRRTVIGSPTELVYIGLNVVSLSLVTSLAGSKLMEYLHEDNLAKDRLDSELRDRDHELETEAAERQGAEALAVFYRDFDGLTHLPNRVLFERELGQSIRKAERHDRLIAVLAIGLDRFGRVRDSYGHDAGDALLLDVAEALRKIFRDDDIVARIGDEHFAVLCGDLRMLEDAMGLIGKAGAVFDHPFLVDGANAVKLGVSIGIALYPNDGADAAGLIRAAESALRLSRESGAPRVFDADIQREFVEQLRLEEELVIALDRGRIKPWFQPKVDSLGHIVGAEALARWRLSDGSFCSPESFIPIAERTGQIVELGLSILNKACEAAASWTYDENHPVTISVNLSPFQFRSPSLVSEVRNALLDSHLEPWRLDLEITESGIAAVEDEAVERLSELKGLGLSLSIDDFGTGTSSISRLRDYPVDALKVPKTFVDPLPTDARASAIARAVIDLAHNLDFEVIAEGVEDRSQFDWLKSASCDQYQGYFFAPALEAEGFAAALAKGFRARVE
jgi:diguanylate cyclase (GGDEF)-like protein